MFERCFKSLFSPFQCKKNSFISDKNVVFFLFCILVHRPIGGEKTIISLPGYATETHKQLLPYKVTFTFDCALEVFYNSEKIILPWFFEVFILQLLLLFYRTASEGWQPPMSIEDTRESPLAQKCYWHRIIPEAGGHFDPCTKQGTPTTRRRPPLVGLEKCSQMHKRG